MECADKTGVRDFEFCAQGDGPVWQVENGFRSKECSSQDQRMAVWLILNEIWKSQVEIPESEQKVW
jgi:hypothetical protein